MLKRWESGFEYGEPNEGMVRAASLGWCIRVPKRRTKPRCLSGRYCILVTSFFLRMGPCLTDKVEPGCERCGCGLKEPGNTNGEKGRRYFPGCENRVFLSRQYLPACFFWPVQIEMAICRWAADVMTLVRHFNPEKEIPLSHAEIVHEGQLKILQDFDRPILGN